MSSPTYRSTRSSKDQALAFEDVVMTGLANDGGLFLPSDIPTLPTDFLTTWKDLSFQELAFNIMRLYVGEEEIPDEDLKTLITKSYSTFRSDKITPLEKLDKSLYLLELFHGPTYAFKDVALQFVGNLFEYFLTRRNATKTEGEAAETVTVVGATSGDTGSAAIYGLRGKKNVSVFIMYPTGRISPIQEEQMTTVLDKNVHTLSVKGTFDDCQDIVKEIFADVEFNEKYHVGAVNSINWARILAQITYYFHSYFELARTLGEAPKIKYVVPSGNFGDILAGYFAKKMGLPIEQLIIATNENDILNRFIKTGKYSKSADETAAEVKATYSPAMDILISSNFERLLWYLARDNLSKNDNEAGEILAKWMSELKQNGSFEVPASVLKAAQADFDAERVTDEETSATIKEIYSQTKYILDPHTSVGVTSSLRHIAKDSISTFVSLSTAHPAKFADVVNQALGSFSEYSFEKDVLPEELKALATKEKKLLFIEKADAELVKEAIIKELQKE